jgi:hypothetical protein
MSHIFGASFAPFGSFARPLQSGSFAQVKNIPDSTTHNFSRRANGLSPDPANVESGCLDVFGRLPRTNTGVATVR